MSKTNEDIRKALEALQSGLPQHLPAKVKEVAEETCTLDFEGLEIFNVKLRASENREESKFLLKPKVGSYVVMSRIMHSKEFYVSMVSEVDEVYVSTNLTQFNSGEFGGLIKVEELVSKINKIESDLNTIKSAFSAWEPVAQDGGAALKILATGALFPPYPPGAWAGEVFEPTQKEELENTKIKHG